MGLDDKDREILGHLLGKIDNDSLVDLIGAERFGKVVGAAADKAEPYKPPQSWTLRELIKQYPDYRDPLIDGLLRRGEIMNVISAAKRGKTWLIMDLAISVASGNPWLGFPVKQGAVLVLDNELHPETISQRGKKIVEERQFELDVFGDNIHYLVMRGCLRDIDLICQDITNFKYPVSLVVIDALYRTYPEKTDENDNGTMAVLYNKLDKAILKLNAGMVLVHHASKGNQSSKALTDVGSGAGAFGRATDTHMILRPHEEDDVVVAEAVPRTFPQPRPRCLRYQYPLWVEAADLDPAKLAGLNGKKKKSDATPPVAPIGAQELVEKFVTNEKRTVKQVYSSAKLAGHSLGVNNVRDMLQSAFISGFVHQDKAKHGTLVYWVGEAELFPDAHDEPDTEIHTT